MQTSGIKYMGSKNKLLPKIHDAVEKVLAPPGDVVFADVFTGSTRVAQFYRHLGYQVITSDLAWASEAYAGAFLQNPTADRKILEELIEHLNALPPIEGWLTATYGGVEPALRKDPTKRVNAFTPENAMKADAIREELACLQPELEKWEFDTLVTSLIFALDKVQNSQGHSRAFFREYLAPACKMPLVLTMPQLVGKEGAGYAKSYPVGKHFTGNVLSSEYRTFLKKAAGKKKIVAYLDPPYTAAAAYDLFYHIWDSVYRWDKPQVVGATNMRADRLKRMGDGVMVFDQDMKSDWCNPKEAGNAFVQLFANLDFVDTFFLSYSDESILNSQQLNDVFQQAGLQVHDKQDIVYKRHALARAQRVDQNKRDERGTKNIEWVYTLTRAS